MCDEPSGNAGSFRCPYHGWTYRNNGELLGYPSTRATAARASSNSAMGKVPRVAVYHGFVFGSFAEEGPTLVEHLGDAAGEIDRLARLSPEGEVELTAGWLRHKTRANWKLLAENETDGYHPQFVHGSIFSVTGSHIGELYSDAATAVTRAIRQRPQRERPASRVPPDGRTDEAGSAPPRTGSPTTSRRCARSTARPPSRSSSRARRT